ncbi:MAG: radical SAM protein [Nitrososphaerota archaeon]|nr:radical SAM protein [Candidatus Bathyarchaeota archaeon]MDW8048639.1 radical SAM protein [Nitrososphaerota archaeon]
MHRCVYCYAIKFPSFRGPIIPRFELKNLILKMIKGTEKRYPVMLSDSTDPYMHIEAKCEITKKCVEALAVNGFPLLIVTKSDLVTRDINLFKMTRTVVTMTVTSPEENVARLIEPNAPPPNARFRALEKVVEAGLPAVIRIDPIIPTLNDDPKELDAIVRRAAEIGVKQITGSTLKVVPGLLPSMKMECKRLYDRLIKVYSDGEWVGGYKYLRVDKRLKILTDLRNLALKHGLEFATCREGFPQLNTTVCDGTAYCRSAPQL